jgi:hypothetical protein
MVRRKQKRKGGLLVGTLVGVAAGFVGGTALLRRAATSEATIEAIGVQPDGVTEAFVETVREAPASTSDQLRTLVDSIKARWNQALAEGRVAAADKERELETRLAFETKRVPAMEGELIQRIEERLHRSQASEQPAGPQS